MNVMRQLADSNKYYLFPILSTAAPANGVRQADIK